MADEILDDELETSEILVTLGDKTDQDLRRILDELYAEESRLSYRRRVLHARIDIVREELIQRMKSHNDKGEPLFGSEDISKLSAILAKEGIGVGSFRHVDADDLGDQDVFK